MHTYRFKRSSEIRVLGLIEQFLVLAFFSFITPARLDAGLLRLGLPTLTAGTRLVLGHDCRFREAKMEETRETGT